MAAGIIIDITTGAVSAGGIPSAARQNKGKSLVEFPERYTVVDIETTGLDPRFDEIIEVAGIRYDRGEELGRFQSLIRPDMALDPFITELTGITNEMIADAPGIEAVLPEFLAFLGDDIIVGHNVNFDINFLYDYASYLKLPPVSNDFVDTLRLARRLYKELPNHKLPTLMEHLGVGDTVEHRALSDCVNTQKCFEKMRAYADEIGGIPALAGAHFNSLSKYVTPTTTDFDPDTPIYGRAFAFTGTLERMTRREAAQKVVDMGGVYCDGVTAQTNYLVLGCNDYCAAIKGGKSSKQKKAEKMQLSGMDIAIISENVFYDMLGL